MESPNPENSTVAEEISRDEFLANFLTDDTLNDFTIEGNDGVQIRANRYVLSARSKVFHSMLLGGFLEKAEHIVKLGYTASVLQAIVEYVLTDSAEIFRLDKKRKDTFDGESSFNNFSYLHSLISLTGAAEYFQLPLLSRKTHDFISRALKERPSLSFAALEAARRERPAVPKECESLILWNLRSKRAWNISASDVEYLSPSVLEEIVQDSKLQMDEYQIFRILELFASSTAVGYGESQPDRKMIASNLIKHIRLEDINPSLLATSVTSSGIVPEDQLTAAYKTQALNAEKTHPAAFPKLRYNPPTPTTHTDITEKIYEYAQQFFNESNKANTSVGDIIRRIETKLNLTLCLKQKTAIQKFLKMLALQMRVRETS